MPCELGQLCVCNTEQKQFCKNWEPGRGSKYYKCARFLTTRASCDKDRSSCKTCIEFIDKLPRREGKINWKDKNQVKAHRAKYMRDYRKGGNKD